MSAPRSRPQAAALRDDDSDDHSDDAAALPRGARDAPPRPHLLRRRLHLIGAAVASAAGYLSIMDYGAHVDGPGIGFPAFVGSALRVVWALGGAAFVVGAALQERRLRSFLVAVNAGVVLFTLLLLTQSAQRLFALSWASRCEAGEARACLGMGGLHRAGIAMDRDEAQATRYYLRACEGSAWVACERILESDDAPLGTRACELVQTGCDVSGDRAACATRDRRCSALKGSQAPKSTGAE